MWCEHGKERQNRRLEREKKHLGQSIFICLWATKHEPSSEWIFTEYWTIKKQGFGFFQLWHVRLLNSSHQPSPPSDETEPRLGKCPFVLCDLCYMLTLNIMLNSCCNSERKNSADKNGRKLWWSGDLSTVYPCLSPDKCRDRLQHSLRPGKEPRGS